MIRLAQAQPKSDFKIPAPAAPAQSVPTQAPPAPPASAGPRPSTGAWPVVGDRWQAPTNTEIAVGAGILALLAVVFFFVRIGVKNYLRDQRAPIDAANGASWTLFVALLLTALVVVAATIGSLWNRIVVTGPALTVCALVFVVFVVQFVRAPRRAR